MRQRVRAASVLAHCAPAARSRAHRTAAQRVVSIWIIQIGESVLRFVTAYPEDWHMSIELLDTVVMRGDVPGHGMKSGDVGAVVQVYSDDPVEVEFVTAAGHTQAVVTLGTHQIRPVGPRDILAVRQLDAA
jgi:hypothetical protein